MLHFSYQGNPFLLSAQTPSCCNLNPLILVRRGQLNICLQQLPAPPIPMALHIHSVHPGFPGEHTFTERANQRKRWEINPLCLNSPRPAGNPRDASVCCSLMLWEQGRVSGLVPDTWLEGWERLEVSWICLSPSAAAAARQQSLTVTHTLLKATFSPQIALPRRGCKGTSGRLGRSPWKLSTESACL